MSSVHALLLGLQDLEKRTPVSVRHLLLELASCCRCEDAKNTILADGLQPLLALAGDDQELPRGEALEVLLDLLVLLVLEDPKAKANAARAGALEVAVRCLHELSADSTGGRRRAKILKRALELVALLSHSAESQQQEMQTIVIKQVVQMMTRVNEDETVLGRATDTLGRFIDGSVERIQVVAKEGAVVALIELLRLDGEKVELKRTACEVLILVGEAAGMLQMMATQNVVCALCLCLRVENPARELEDAVVRLLLRLAKEARVYGQIVHEEMVPLLFRVIERNSDSRELAATACTIIADVTDFAVQCKLDLSPFVEGCSGKVLVLAATCHAQDANIVDSTFRIFVNISSNPVDLPLLINSETIEGLLSLYVLAGGSGYLAELAGHLVHVISKLSRSTLEQFTIQQEDITLPALFLCLRNYHEDTRFASQVFSILAKHWKTQCQQKSVRSITGYVGIAIDVLCTNIQFSKSWGDETAEICNFIREMVLSKDGANIVLGCGGKDLLEVLHTHLTVRDTTGVTDVCGDGDPCNTIPKSPLLNGVFGGEKIAFVVVNMLEKAVLGLIDLATINSSSEPSSNDHQSLVGGVASMRIGDAEYDEYVTRLLHLENSCRYKPTESTALRKNADSAELAGNASPISLTAAVSAVDISQDFGNVGGEEAVEQNASGEYVAESVDVAPSVDSSGEDEAAEEDNDDDSDDDDDDIEKEKFSSDLVEETRVPSPCSYPRSSSQSSLERRNSIAHEDRKWYYVDSALVKYPKHPSRMSQEGQNNSEEEFVLDDPGFIEPCNLPETEVGTRFIEEAVARRAEFIDSDVNSRARAVYGNMSMVVEDCEKQLTGIPPFLLNSCATHHDTPYFVPEITTAFSDLASSLTFDSNFESGNLERAIRIGPYEYDLVLRHDFNSSGHMQWFYFAVSNIQPPTEHPTSPRSGQKYRFNIVNLCKPNSLFNQGLQPVVYSVRDAHQKGKGWVRSGTDIYYFANSFVRPPRNAANFSGVAPSDTIPAANAASASPVSTYYTLTFTLDFCNVDDTYLIAHSYPYTFTMHQLHIDNILHHPGYDTKQILRHSTLCKTLSGRNCDLLTISDFSHSKEMDVRRAVFITSRVHPGESQASWMMRGVIDFLLGNSTLARVLRRMFVFQIIPMLNPDGVYYGNSRCGLSACDLNRQWQTPSKALHPTIFHAKELLTKERSSRGVAFYCDMHGHSRKKNVFMYGCDTKRKPNPAARTFAKLFSMQQTAKKYISFPDCSFKVSRDKETTARVVVANELKINWSFTLEASFCGANYGELQNMHFNTKHLREVGASLCETLFQACVANINARDRLVTLVDDEIVCIPEHVESCLREAGAVEGFSVDENTIVNPRALFRKGKSGSGKKLSNEIAQKNLRRKTSKARAVVASESGSSKLIETNEGSGMRRKLSRQTKKSSSLSSGLLDGVTRDASIPVFVTNESTTGLELEYIPPKLSGRKLRSKYPKVRRTKSSPDGYAKPSRRSFPSLASNDVVDEPEIPVDKINTPGCGDAASNCPSSDTIMPLVSPSKLSATVPGPPTSFVRTSLGSFQGPESTYVRSTKSISFPYPSNMPQLRDPSMLLPSPVSEVLTRSPKAPASRIRFRGAGRQFAAVNTIPRTSIHDILRSDSATAYQSYEADLISASTMVIRQRGSSNNVAAADEKILSPPPSRYLSFPSVI